MRCGGSLYLSKLLSKASFLQKLWMINTNKQIDQNTFCELAIGIIIHHTKLISHKSQDYLLRPLISSEMSDKICKILDSESATV